MVDTLRPDSTLQGVAYMRTDPEGAFVTKDDYDTIAASVEYHKDMAAKWQAEAQADLARIVALESALTEARRWLGDGDMSDGMEREIWTPAYASVVDLVDAALRDSQP